MDPALYELLRVPPADGEVEASLRLSDSAAAIPGVRVVTRFGSIVTCRMPAARLVEIRGRDEVASLKAARVLGPESTLTASLRDTEQRPTDLRRPNTLPYRGRGIVIGLLDWGFAVGSPALRHADGRTRLLGLWDQRRSDPHRPNNFGYGVIHTARDINSALKAPDPYLALSYHPADSDRLRHGAHGTITMDIAAGNGRGGGPLGIAPEADIVCVHLATEAPGTDPRDNLGDSVRVLEAIAWIRDIAGSRPFVINASLGRHGGPHDGTTLVELASDWMMSQNPNCICVHSAGNYRTQGIHASGRLAKGETSMLRIMTNAHDLTRNEVELWHDAGAKLSVRLEAPDGEQSSWFSAGDRAQLTSDGRVVARLYYREHDPQNDASLVDLFLEPEPPGGQWRLHVRADEAPVRGATFHAWIERDDACSTCQARFHPDDADDAVTTSTLANARRTLSVGAVDGHDATRPVAPFSSAGPTRDGRSKPDCVAPGVSILAARSPWYGERDGQMLGRRSGTSMAAPHVSGCAALVLEAARGQLGDGQLREIILSSADPAGAGCANRYGAGCLNIERAIAVAERIAQRREISPTRSFVDLGAMENHMSSDRNTSTDILDIVDGLLRDVGITSGDEILRMLLRRVAGVESEAPAYRVFSAARDGRFSPALPVDHVSVIARPRERVDAVVRAGDLLVRRALGEGALTHVAVVAGPELRQDQLASAGLVGEDDGPGWFVPVLEGGFHPHTAADRFARRLRDASGDIAADQVLVRIIPSESQLVTEALEEAVSNELVLFAQRILNRAERERLMEDGNNGPLTQAALQRFRARHGLGTGSALDDTTGLALVQRGLEELAQQSLFQIGVRDSNTESAIAAFKSQNGLGHDAALDAPLRVALAQALVKAKMPTTAGASPVDWTTVSESDRMRYVMKLLVEKYGYPDTGAAGIVGNLYAESQVIPNRVQGSDPLTPMRAMNTAGVLTDFTAEQVMTLTPVAPAEAGVGLAQWTYPPRRRGLFAHEYNGVVPGASILYDMDAQVDYLVSELTHGYAGVNTVVRGANVSVDRASDEVTANFETPATMFEWHDGPKGAKTVMGPRLQPTAASVQEEFARRRRYAHRALAAYRRS